MKHLDSEAVVQIGIIVEDVERTARHYGEVFGVPVPQVVPIAADSYAHTIYQDKPSHGAGRAAFFKLGPVEIELIQPVGAPSTWEEFLRERGEGLHHIAFRTEKLEEAQEFLSSRGMKSIQSGGWDGGRYAYVDARQQLGTILELLHFD
jgi:catechol 2,3-dioxygenase-like lactoylglutathione lyase family enzyme